MTQGLLNYGMHTELMQPFARRILRVFGILCSVYVVFAFLTDDSLSFIWGVLLAIIGLGSIFIYTNRSRLYYAPLIFTLFYFFGYILSIPFLLLDKESIPRTGFGAIGDFMFTDPNFLAVVLTIAAGMAGILTATLLAEKISRAKRRMAIKESSELGAPPKDKLYKWILLWGGFSIGLVLLMWSMEVGRTGLTGNTQLPFKLVGLFVYLKMLFVPFCGVLLLDISLRTSNRVPAILTLVMLFIIGILSSLGATSRGAFVFGVFPAILFLLFTSRKNNLSQKLFVVFSSIALVLAAIVASVVNVVRSYVFSDMNWGLSNSLNLLGSLNASDFDFFKIIQEFIALATGRIGGMRELMAVIGSGVADMAIPFKMFLGTISVDDYASITHAVMGFIPYSDDRVGFGITFGMWGQLYFGDSYFMVYSGSALLTGIVICFEEIFMRKGMYSVALLISIILAFQFWGSASMFFISRFVAVLFLCYLFVVHVMRNHRRKYC